MFPVSSTVFCHNYKRDFITDYCMNVPAFTPEFLVRALESTVRYSNGSVQARFGQSVKPSQIEQELPAWLG